MKTVAIIQARMASTRLPGKVLCDIEGKTMLQCIFERVSRAQTVDQIVVATSTGGTDDPIDSFCRNLNIECFRGSEHDVLSRFYEAACLYHAEVIVRITADCPLIDPGVIDKVVRAFFESNVDYAANVLHYTYPDGLDTEVFSFVALERVVRTAIKPAEREHVTSLFRFGSMFRTLNVESEHDHTYSKLRFTVDDIDDLARVRGIYRELGKDGAFDYDELLGFIMRNQHNAALESSTTSNYGYYKSLYDQATSGAAPPRPMVQSQAWLARASKVIPNASQTFSKSTSQYVKGISPVFLQRGKGCQVWDVDNNSYIDYVQGLLPNILGYAHEEVNAAAFAQSNQGHSFSLPHPLEVELAERLVRLIPCAEMVRFGKNGSDATAGAVRAARAITGRQRIACCGYHGWQDWYIGSTSRHAGVPDAVRNLTHPFPYNDLSELEKLLSKHPSEFAAVIMEPVNFHMPAPGYLEGVKKLAHKHQALLIFDEICSGFHLGLGGAQQLFGVQPDMACFGKALGNGFPISCVVGRKDLMTVFSDIFFSFTLGGEVASMAAAVKVLDVLENTDALAQMQAMGRRLQDGFNTFATLAGVADRFTCTGFPTWSLIQYKDMLHRSLFQQEAIKRGILIIATHNLTAAHDNSAVEHTLEMYAEIFKTLGEWLHNDDPASHLEGPMVEAVFKVRG